MSDLDRDHNERITELLAANNAEVERRRAAERNAAAAIRERDEAIQCLRALFENRHIDLGDQVYEVREREGLGWDGPSVTAWSEAVTAGRHLLARQSDCPVTGGPAKDDTQ